MTNPLGGDWISRGGQFWQSFSNVVSTDLNVKFWIRARLGYLS